MNQTNHIVSDNLINTVIKTRFKFFQYLTSRVTIMTKEGKITRGRKLPNSQYLNIHLEVFPLKVLQGDTARNFINVFSRIMYNIYLTVPRVKLCSEPNDKFILHKNIEHILLDSQL